MRQDIKQKWVAALRSGDYKKPLELCEVETAFVYWVYCVM
jgi:hypothetical protein